MADRRRQPRAIEIVLMTDTGERARFVGRLAEVLAAFAATLALDPSLASEDRWTIELSVLERKIVPRVVRHPATIPFRDYHDDKEAS